ncbi:hypothetical protein DCAR_0934312 [Daucus carota subsp. sativus]|uniref:Protein kinase domain-containing protein n=2 Tax=Daucus carota subsp. sativus TaxID=79200 RepID=A0AAF0XXF7_DAUCS|nr:hypothetical protein DCAR_0934312 [Daucus carota subsp. sativus]
MELVLKIILVSSVLIQEVSAQETSVAMPDCPQKCGDVTIHYPFGIGRNCSLDWRIQISCNDNFTPPKPFLNYSNLEVVNISVLEGTIEVKNPVFKDCSNRGLAQRVVFVYKPFRFSSTRNLFIAMGCNNLAVIKNLEGSNLGGCMSFCDQKTLTIDKRDCFGVKCCQAIVPPYFWNFTTSLRTTDDDKNLDDICKYAFIVNKKWFENLTDIYSVQLMKEVPAVLDWNLNLTDECYTLRPTNVSRNMSVCGTYATCHNLKCSCLKGYQGNPYLPHGCRDTDECAPSHKKVCAQNCMNTPGGYRCSCKRGWELDTNARGCTEATNVKKARIILAIASCTILGVVLVLAATWWLCKVMKRRRVRIVKEMNFERNGGLLLRQQVSSIEGNVDTTKLFSSKELDMATDHYNKDRILGQGGQGTVYKGMLADGSIVAVKKSKIDDESKKEQFINEVVLLSKTNHRNIVKLHGCCLETDVPLLVYEFIPNGTLFEYIHDYNQDFPLTWDIRVRIAIEIAGALFYLHSASSLPIYHRDIKSSNILLDKKYKAKLADFGTSKSIAIDQTHLTTRVQGTFGYLDPEYFQSSQYTDKSDVYSFGVVLVELLTGQKPILAPRAHDEERSLATHFILAMKENRIFDILDPRFAKEGDKEEIKLFADIAYRCLNLNGRKRPTMKQVAAELESIDKSHTLLTAEQQYEEIEYPVSHLNGLWDLTSTSMSSGTSNSVKVDIEPLIPKY